MANRMFFLFLFSFPIALLILTSCQESSVNEGDTTPSSSVPPSDTSSSPHSSLDGISMRTEKDVYREGVEQLTVVLTNASEEEVYYGKHFSVEKQTENGWEAFPFKEDVAFIEIAILLEPDDEKREDIDLTLLKNKLTGGKYRILKQIGGEEFFAEFQVE